MRESSLGGFGVFAPEPYAKGDVVEVCRYLELEADAVRDSALWDYVFESQEDGRVLVILGHGMLYNHSYRPNLYYELREEGQIQFVAKRKIPAGTELTINYGRVWWNSRGLRPV
jgi:hypothetical protein